MVKENAKLYTCISFVVIFLGSMQSFYFSGIELSILTIFSMIIISTSSFFSFTLKQDLLVIWVVVLSNLLLFLFILSFIDIHSIKSAFGILISSLSSLMLITVFINRSTDLVRGIEITLQIHAAFIFAQAIWFISSGNYLDFLVNITGEEQRYISNKGIFIGGIRIPRFTGLFNEPGTYANYISALTAVLFSIQRKLTTTIYLSLASIFLTASLFGYVFVALLVIIFSLSQINSIKKFAINLILYSIFGILFLYYYLESILIRFNSDYSGLEFRSDMIELLINRDAMDIFIGAGTIADLLPDWIVVNDIGLIYYTLFSFGFAGLVFMIIIFIPIARTYNWVTIAIFGLLLLSKIKLTYPMFWYCWAILCISNIKLNTKATSTHRKHSDQKIAHSPNTQEHSNGEITP